MRLWHGTTLEAAKLIAATGRIQPGHPSQWDGTHWKPMDGCVYFSTKPSDCAWHMIYRTFRGNYAKAPKEFGIVAADVPESLLLPDEDDVADHIIERDAIGLQIEERFIATDRRLSRLLAAARKNPTRMTDPQEDWENDESPYSWPWPNDTGSEQPHPNFQTIARAITPLVAALPEIRDGLFLEHSKRAILGDVPVSGVWSIPTFETADDFIAILTRDVIARLGTKIELRPAGSALPSPAMDPADFQARVIAAQDLAEKAKEYGIDLTISAAGCVRLFHGTSKEKAAAIRRGGFEKATYFSHDPSVTGYGDEGPEFYAKTKNKDGEVMAVWIDPHDVSFAGGTGEFFLEAAVTPLDGVYSSQHAPTGITEREGIAQEPIRPAMGEPAPPANTPPRGSRSL